MEVIQKIKVNPSKEVHLYLALPQKISLFPTGAKALGSTVQSTALPLKNTQKAICQIAYSLKDYYNNNKSSTKL
jgi:hypothetical protein